MNHLEPKRAEPLEKRPAPLICSRAAPRASTDRRAARAPELREVSGDAGLSSPVRAAEPSPFGSGADPRASTAARGATERRWVDVQVQRAKLGPSERLFVTMRRHFATNVVRAIQLEGDLPPERVQEALAILQPRHPLLNACIVDGRAPHYIHDVAGPIRLQIVPRQSDEDVLRLLQALLDTPLPLDGSAHLTAYYLYAAGSGRSELLVAAEHAICDGVSMNSLCAELLELCAGRAARPVRPRLPPLSELLPRSSLGQRVASFGAAFGRFARLAASRRRHEPARPARTSALSSAHAVAQLGREQTSGLVARCRLARTTVTGAIMAAVAMALRDAQPHTPRLALSVPVNLRPHLEGHALSPGDLGNYTSVAYLESPARGPFWELARELKGQLEDAVAPDRLLPAVDWTYRSGRRFVRPGRPPFAHAMVSNSGIVPLERDLGSFRPCGFYSASSAPMLSADISFFCNTLHGRLSLNLVYSEELLSRDRAQRLLARVHRTLTALPP
jgi:hypothetical protein